VKLANINGKPALALERGYVDVATASGGRFGNYEQVFADWAGFRAWADAADVANSAALIRSDVELGPAVVNPGQIFGAGFNYAAHVEETASVAGEVKDGSLPLIFTKFPTSITGPTGQVELPDGSCDFEVELVAVIGLTADRVSVNQAWFHVAGLLVGQDVSSRKVQFLDPQQHSVGKSFRTFAPLGPALVTPDELSDPTDLQLRCWINGELRQKSSTLDMIYPVAELVALLSAVTTLQPGDLIFTGTPAGVGAAEDPPRYLQPGDVIVSDIEGLGRMENRCVQGSPAPDIGQQWHS
jgi:2-keto-4-pentenoate hydratase/2-oxohepta-3-ene-1,7-dioic acid hydratase in catechol pathway